MALEVKLCGYWMDNYGYPCMLALEATLGVDTVVIDAQARVFTRHNSEVGIESSGYISM